MSPSKKPVYHFTGNKIVALYNQGPGPGTQSVTGELGSDCQGHRVAIKAGLAPDVPIWSLNVMDSKLALRDGP